MKCYGIENVTVRLTVRRPENYASVQRLYDYGAWFELEKEMMFDPDKITDFINDIKARGGKMIDSNKFISDDDFEEKETYTFELKIKY